MKVEWDTVGPRDQNHFEFQDYIGTTAKTVQPTWYQKLSYWINDRKSWREVVARDFDDLFKHRGQAVSYKTVKGCPAYINFFKQSFALKTPCDIFMKVYQSKNEEGKINWYYEWSTDGRDWDITEHSPKQLGKIGDDNLAIKFSLNFSFRCDEDTQFQYVDPYIANKVHYRVSPGVVSLKKGSPGQINMVTFFEKKEEEYWIPAGSTLGYVQFDKVIKKFVRGDLTNANKRKKYFTFEKGDHNEYLAKQHTTINYHARRS